MTNLTAGLIAAALFVAVLALTGCGGGGGCGAPGHFGSCFN